MNFSPFGDMVLLLLCINSMSQIADQCMKFLFLGHVDKCNCSGRNDLAHPFGIATQANMRPTPRNLEFVETTWHTRLGLQHFGYGLRHDLAYKSKRPGTPVWDCNSPFWLFTSFFVANVETTWHTRLGLQLLAHIRSLDSSTLSKRPGTPVWDCNYMPIFLPISLTLSKRPGTPVWDCNSNISIVGAKSSQVETTWHTRLGLQPY